MNCNDLIKCAECLALSFICFALACAMSWIRVMKKTRIFGLIFGAVFEILDLKSHYSENF